MKGVSVPKWCLITSCLVRIVVVDLVDSLSGSCSGSWSNLMEEILIDGVEVGVVAFFPSSTHRWMASAGPRYGRFLL